jgi:hypothetical protein
MLVKMCSIDGNCNYNENNHINESELCTCSAYYFSEILTW